jgi:hypothetical protein
MTLTQPTFSYTTLSEEQVSSHPSAPRVVLDLLPRISLDAFLKQWNLHLKIRDTTLNPPPYTNGPKTGYEVTIAENVRMYARNNASPVGRTPYGEGAKLLAAVEALYMDLSCKEIILTRNGSTTIIQVPKIVDIDDDDPNS